MFSTVHSAADRSADPAEDREGIVAWALTEYERLLWELEMKLEWRVSQLATRPVNRFVPGLSSTEYLPPR